MWKKIKCDVCGCKYFPRKEQMYAVKKYEGLNALVNGGNNVYYAQDCPVCGCQMVLKERIDKA